LQVFWWWFGASRTIVEIIKDIFGKRGLQVTESNRKQAEVPSSCEVLLNKNGTAPGMLFRKGGKILVSMPGVPFEMKGLMETSVLPYLGICRVIR
jgi:nicotinamide-nucleotide amidase